MRTENGLWTTPAQVIYLIDFKGALCGMVARVGIATMLLIEIVLPIVKFDLFMYTKFIEVFKTLQYWDQF